MKTELPMFVIGYGISMDVEGLAFAVLDRDEGDRLNSVTARALYLGTRAMTREADEKLAPAGAALRGTNVNDIR